MILIILLRIKIFEIYFEEICFNSYLIPMIYNLIRIEKLNKILLYKTSQINKEIFRMIIKEIPLLNNIIFSEIFLFNFINFLLFLIF